MKFSLFCMFGMGLYAAGHCQTTKHVNIVGDPFPREASTVFVSEIHNNPILPEFNFAVISYTRDASGISNIVYEYGRAFAYLCNLYLEKQDTTIYRYRGPKFRAYLEECRIANQSLPADKRIKVYGIDFERMEFVEASMKMLSRCDKGRNCLLHAYLSGIPDSLYLYDGLNKEERTTREAIYGRAREIYAQERDTLKGILDSKDDSILSGILTNPVLEKHFALRDKWMAVSLQEQVGDRKFICITGAIHANVHSKSSFISKYLRHVHPGRVVLINEVCRYKDGAMIGPKFLRDESVKSTVYNKFYSTSDFTLVHHSQLSGFTNRRTGDITTYYILSENMSATPRAVR